MEVLHCGPGAKTRLKVWETSPPEAEDILKIILTTRMWANANVMAALPNIGGAYCSTPQSLADAHY